MSSLNAKSRGQDKILANNMYKRIEAIAILERKWKRNICKLAKNWFGDVIGYVFFAFSWVLQRPY